MSEVVRKGLEEAKDIEQREAAGAVLAAVLIAAAQLVGVETIISILVGARVVPFVPPPS